MSSRKDLLQSTAKFTNDNLSTLTLCNAKSASLTKENQAEIKHLNLLNFKIFKCDKGTCSDMKNCLYFHSELDRRRSLIKHKYVSDLCENVAKGVHCPFQDYCKYSHNHFESLYHHTKYKKRFCNSYPDKLETCKYQRFCSYAHSEEEILIVLLHNYHYDRDFFLFHYKTHFCPFSFIPHNRSSCVYAHNWQDLRRNPYEMRTLPMQCRLWKEKTFLLHYSDGCPYGSKCEHSHGWKEADFHPLNYKRTKCEKKNCGKSEGCPNYHFDAEKRYALVMQNSSKVRDYWLLHIGALQQDCYWHFQTP